MRRRRLFKKIEGRDTVNKNIIHYTYDGKQYPCIFPTADALVICYIAPPTAPYNPYLNTNILLIRREDNGKLALPGGFVEYKESSLEAAIRECYEDTGVKVSKPINEEGVTFSDPHRGNSKWNRNITTAFAFGLGAVKKLPRLKAGDDAQHAFWIEESMLFSNYTKRDFHDDHYDIIKKLLDRAKYPGFYKWRT